MARIVGRSAMTAMEASPAFHRLMSWLTLEGENASVIMSRHPVVADVGQDTARRGAADPVLVAAMTALMGISIRGYEVLVNRAALLEDGDATLRDAVLDMYVNWYADQFNKSEERTPHSPGCTPSPWLQFLKTRSK